MWLVLLGLLLHGAWASRHFEEESFKWPLVAREHHNHLGQAGEWHPQKLQDEYNPHTADDTCTNNTVRTQRIPDRFHLVMLLDPQEHFAFGLIEFLCVRSIKVNANPEDGIYFHYINEPTGPWWELAKPMVKMVNTHNITTYMGHTLRYKQHVTDILRLEILTRYGGVYVDLDTLVLRSFKPLYQNHAVLGWEGTDAQVENGIILAEPGSMFLQRFLGAFAHYTHHWLFTVQTGARLYLEYQSEVCLMPPHFAYYPLWTEKGHEMLYSERTGEEMEKMTTTVLDTDGLRKNVLFEGQYAYHTWWRLASVKCRTVVLYNLTYINNVNTLMNFLLRPLVAGMDPSEWPASPYLDSPCEHRHSDY